MKLNVVLYLILLIMSCSSPPKNISHHVVTQSDIESIESQKSISRSAEQESNDLSIGRFSGYDRDLLFSDPTMDQWEYIDKIFNNPDLETVFFEPIKEGERFEYEIQEFKFFGGFDSLTSDEITVYIIRDDGRRELIKRMLNYSYTLNDPETTPGHLFYYAERNEEFDAPPILWHFDGSKGIGRVLFDTVEKRFSCASYDAKYLIGYMYEHDRLKGRELIWNGKFDQDILIYSLENEEFVKTIDFDDYGIDLSSSYYTYKIKHDQKENAFDVLIETEIPFAYFRITIPDFTVEKRTLEDFLDY